MNKDYLDKMIGKNIGYKHLVDVNPEIVDKSVARKITHKPYEPTRKEIRENNKKQMVKTMSNLRSIALRVNPTSVMTPMQEKVGY